MPKINERDYFIPLRYGQWGVTWLMLDREISREDNPLMFTCSECRTTCASSQYNSSKEAALVGHKKGCRNLLMMQLGM
jgi:hypothetical protein